MSTAEVVNTQYEILMKEKLSALCIYYNFAV